jgi:hypothetical protein
MEPSHLKCDINDVLDKLLNKGLALDADLIISVAGIPLLGVKLKAAIAGMETMLEYGMMEAWDRNTREWYEKEYKARSAVPLAKNEKIIIKTFGSIWNDQGIISTWKNGIWYLTNSRLFLARGEPAEILFEISLDKVGELVVTKEVYFGQKRDELHVQSNCGELVRIHVSNVIEFKQAIEDALTTNSFTEHDKVERC